jgi:hypothetical protein
MGQVAFAILIVVTIRPAWVAMPGASIHMFGYSEVVRIEVRGKGTEYPHSFPGIRKPEDTAKGVGSGLASKGSNAQCMTLKRIDGSGKLHE